MFHHQPPPCRNCLSDSCGTRREAGARDVHHLASEDEDMIVIFQDFVKNLPIRPLLGVCHNRPQRGRALQLGNRPSKTCSPFYQNEDEGDH